jgi:hypothetical protein
LQKLVALRVREHRNEAFRPHVEEVVADARREHRHRHLDQDRLAVGDAGQLVGERLHVTRREIDFRAALHLERNAGAAQTVVQLANQGRDPTERVVVDAVDQVGCRHRQRDAVGCDALAKLDRVLPIARAVVEPGQKVGVDVDHRAAPAGDARRLRRGFTSN